MFDRIKSAKTKAVSFVKSNANAAIVAVGASIGTAALGAQQAMATTSTALATPTWGPNDIINTVASAVYPAVIPCLTVGATVFVAFWIYHRVRSAL